MARALAVLQTANPNLVTLNDEWALLGDNGNDSFDMGDSASTFRLQIVDAGALININQAPTAQLNMLPISQEMIDCLLDWRETGQQPRPDGAKDDYYNGLPQPYNTRLGSLTTLSELLLIKNWTAQDLYSFPTDVASTVPTPQDAQGNPLPLAALLTVDSGSPNTQATGGGRVNLNVRGLTVTALSRLGVTGTVATQIVARAPFTSFSTLLAMPGLNAQAIQQLLNGAGFTTATRNLGKINLNTASQAVLQTLPNVTPGIASSIVAQQSSGFNSLGDLATVAGVSGALLGQIASAVTVGSDTWIVRAYGQSGGVSVAVEAVVTLTNGNVQIKNWDVLNTSGIPAWWDWQAEPTTTMEAGAS